MKHERKKLGVRVRVLLNRHEAREAARSAMARILEEGSLSERARVSAEAAMSLQRGRVAVFVGRWRGAGAISVPHSALEAACKALAESAGNEVPPGASFRVGVDSDGQVAGAAFQFWELTDDQSDW